MPALANLAIMASAGSGKTHALNSRLITLLALGVPPERIVALTFTKAAAGEIFDDLVERLARAATEPGACAMENGFLRQAGIGELAPAQFALLLRTLIRRLHVGRIGTLDSFLAAVVRSFAVELGVPTRYTIMDEHASTMVRERILRRLLSPPCDEAQRQARQAFLELFRRTTFGDEGKSVFDLLHAFVRNRHQFLLLVPDGRRWGDPAIIWPCGSDLLGPVLSESDVDAAGRELLAAVAGVVTDKRQLPKWEAFVATARQFSLAGLRARASELDFIRGKLLPVLDDLGRGAATVEYYKAMRLGPEACTPLRALLRHITGQYLQAKLQNTQGLQALLTRYESEYERVARTAGRLSFSDLTHLLTRSGLAPSRLDIDYRLDGQYDHWAIDEFQDTSRQQWAAVQNLVDEVIQDGSGQRSFFMVGDVKQAVYGWRGGDSRLMGEIAAYYRLPEAKLDQSYRSCPAVLAAVNGLFGRVANHPSLPVATRQRWARLWGEHAPADRVAAATGCAQVVETETAAGEVAHASAIVELLRRVAPLEHHLETAILVRANDYGVRLTEALRQAGIRVVWESDKAIAAQPLVAALLALLRAAAHPGDTLAQEHVRMSPLWTVVQRCELGPVGLLGRLHRLGFAGTISELLVELGRDGVATAFPEVRALVGSARAFDVSGSRDVLEFVDYIEAFTVRDAPPVDCVRVMTIHHSKGLGFDLVIVPLAAREHSILDPDLNGDMLVREHPSAGPGHDGGVACDWLLDQPGFIAEHDPVLREAVDRARERLCFESLCTLYVAMTRAKRGLCVLVPPLPKTSDTVRSHNLVRDCLCALGPAPGPGPGPDRTRLLYSEGDEFWYQQAQPSRPASTPPLLLPPADLGPVPRHRRELPSQVGHAPGPVANPFRFGSGSGAEFGSAMHTLFEQLEWAESEPLDRVVARWRTARPYPESLARAVEEQFRTAMARSEFAAPLRRPLAASVTLWRERAFDILMDGRWVTGTFDRVVVCGDASGTPTQVTVLDFKSDRVDGEAGVARAVAQYSAQLGLYRQALAQAFAVDSARVMAQLLFTVPGRCVTVS